MNPTLFLQIEHACVDPAKPKFPSIIRHIQSNKFTGICTEIVRLISSNSVLNRKKLWNTKNCYGMTG